MSELKQCPYCGSNAILTHTTKGFTDGSQVICSNSECGASGKWFAIDRKYSSDEKAIEAWNRRASNDHTGNW